ncbi:MAG: hypothetical protein IK142_04830 [Clostridiales bacterium]|nr:hypothetical protein [Clostridiales bacterium]
MEEKSKKLIKGTMVSIIVNVVVFIVSTIILIVVSNFAQGQTAVKTLEVVDSVTFILFVVVWPLINIILSIKALVSRDKPPVGYKGVAVTNLVLSIAGPLLYGLTYLLNLLDPGV